MTKTLLLITALAGAATMNAQGIAAEAKQAYNGIKNNLTKMAEKMPEDAYSYKPVDTIRTFAGLMGHIADSQMGTCSGVNGEAKQLGAANKTSKAELVAAMKASFEECDKAFASLTNENATDMVKTRRGERTRLTALMGIIVHGNEEYGYTAVYMRMKGIVPPSSEGR